VRIKTTRERPTPSEKVFERPPGSGRWYLEISWPRTKPNGGRYRLRASCAHSKSEAEREWRTVLQKLEEGVSSDVIRRHFAPRQDVAAILREYGNRTKHLKTGKPLREKTRKTYARSLAATAPFFQGVLPAMVDKKCLDDFVKYREGLARNTVRAEISFVLAALGWAEAEGPFQKFTDAKKAEIKPAPGDPVGRIVGPLLFETVLSHVTSEERRNAYRLMLELGLRAGECASMRWENVFSDSISIYPDGDGKTPASTRLVPMDEVVRGFLPTASRFAAGRVWNFTVEQLEGTWLRAAKKVDSENWPRLHDLRVTWNSIQEASGDGALAEESGGWEDGSSVRIRHYTKPVPLAMFDALKRQRILRERIAEQERAQSAAHAAEASSKTPAK
jgi:integrase